MKNTEPDAGPTLRLALAALIVVLLGACKQDDPGPAPAGGIGSAAGAGGVAGFAGSAGVSGSPLAGAGAGGSVAPAGGGGGGAPTFTRVFNDVISAKGCNGTFCHGDSRQAGLSMGTQAEAYMSLVSVPAAGPRCGTSGKMRVVPSDPAASLMFDKISNPVPACGDVMPTGTRFAPNCIVQSKPVCTTQDEVSLVRDWIMAGAKND